MATPDGAPEELFTRGGRDAPDTRGLSMVAKHMAQQQKVKEARAMERLHLLLPALGPTVRAVALAQCDWDEEKALTMLRRFQVAKAEELSKLHKERRKHQLALQSGKPEKLAKKAKKESKRGSGSGSGSSSDDSGSGSDDSGSGSGSESEGARRGKRRRSRSRSRSRGRSKRSRKDRKEKRSKRGGSEKKRGKKEKKEKKERRRGDKAAKPKGPGAIGLEYGKHGIIRETDMYAKRPEFQLWAIEVKKVDIEAMPRAEEKEMFRDFMEEYNTASLPHKKFYDLEVWERAEAAKLAKKGGDAAKGAEWSALDDERLRAKELAEERARAQAERLKQAYEELKTTDKAKDMREQQLLRSQMELAYKTGDRAKAAKLAALLAPTDIADIAKPKRAPASGT